MKLSLCIATYNEEKNIHYPLDSAYDLVDEVIIVDGSSTDKTVEIAKSYGKKVKVFIEENPLMFHINKQKAIERTAGEWILQLDADEALSDELKEEIKNVQLSTLNVKRKSAGEVVAYWLPRKNFFLTRFLMKGGQYPDYTIRLYRNGYARFPCKDVHENVEIITHGRTSEVKGGSDEVGGGTSEVNKIGYLKNPILHYADPNLSRYLMRWHRYNNLEAQQLSTIYHRSSIFKKITIFINYCLMKPPITFFLMYFRHLGFFDGLPGLVFAFFSSIRFWEIYFKLFYARSRILKNSK